MVKFKRNRRGGVGIMLMLIVVLFAISINSLIILERKTMSIKRQNIHNAVIASNLASYYAIEQGDPNKVLSINPLQLKDYLKYPDKILSNNLNLEDVVNMLTSEYIESGERYKSVFIKQDVAYKYFEQYLKNNLGLVQSKPYVFTPLSDNNNKGDILRLDVKSFEVYNSIYENMKNISIPTEISKENRKYTGIHLDLNATVKHDINYRSITGNVNVPIHLDTEITLFRPTIK